MKQQTQSWLWYLMILILDFMRVRLAQIVQQLEFPRKRLLRVFGADVWVFDGFQKLIDRNQDTKMIFSSTSNMDGPTGMMELEA